MMANSKEPPYTLVEGVRIPNTPLVKPDTNFTEDLKRFQTRKDDVFVCSYPKSGTNWLCEILWQVYHDGATSNENIGDRVYWFDVHPLLRRPKQDQPDSSPNPKPVIELLPSPRLMRSHLPYHVIPKSADETIACKYIYVVRNPKDALVSLYHFYQAMPETKVLNITLEMMAQDFLQGKVFYNLWSDHVLGFWKHKDDPNILFLKYEDMKKDLLSAVKAIVEFVQKPLPEELIQRIAHQCTFGEMTKNPEAYLTFPGVDDTSYLRKGEAGEWKNYLTTEMSEKFEVQFLAKLKQHGLEFE